MFRPIRLAVAALALSTFWTGAAIGQDAVDPAERARIESIVRDYLLKNPEIILEAMQVLEQRETAATEQRRQEAIAGLVPTLTASPLTPVVGGPGADVTVVEFFDYQCGYCKRLFPGLNKVMESDDGVRVVFVEFPILGPASLVASKAALAAQEQGLYMEYHTALMEFQGRLDDKAIYEKAAEVGLDVDRLKADMQDPKIAQYLEMTRAVADSLNVRGTPAMVIGNQFVGGFVPGEQLEAVIERARAEG
ncbi:MAG: DsbA family protein [Alphaproteobacteria bacterium]|nr:DsbA family protein [Alphaproteobacteria bacterium]MBO6863104.1 DsbA family protein [Alphaproteobacteria bacterium]